MLDRQFGRWNSRNDVVRAAGSCVDDVCMTDDDRLRAAAFDDFFREQHDPLLRLCFALTLDREVARDIAQEAMARAWRDWTRIADGHPVAWSRQVALNLARSRGRRRRTEQAAVMGPVRDAELVVADIDLLRALAELTDRQREAVVLHHLLDLSVADCATSMDVAEPSVKIHLRRGRARLAKALADTHAPDQSVDRAEARVPNDTARRTEIAGRNQVTDRNDTEVPS